MEIIEFYKLQFVNTVTCLPFQKRLNMSTLIAIKVTTNLCLISIKFFIVRTIL